MKKLFFMMLVIGVASAATAGLSFSVSEGLCNLGETVTVDLISDGGVNPYRYHVRPPSFVNLTLIEDMCLGLDLADVVVILGSVDIVLGEVDR